MITATVTFYSVVVFFHIAAVVIGFGPTFAYGAYMATAQREGGGAIPAIGRTIVLWDRTALTGAMTLIAGGFAIEKPYYGLDQGNLFRRLGTVTHRGIEASLSGSPGAGLTLVAGGVLLDATLSGEEVASGSIGRRPIGTPSRILIGTIDWRPAPVPDTSSLTKLREAAAHCTACPL